MTVTHLVTHSGMFHADEVCAYAVLSDLFPKATLVRTRNSDVIEDLAPHAITFDVGMTFDPEARRFDHHQPGAPTRPDGLAYAAFGLVWETYGRLWLKQAGGIPPALCGDVHQRMANGMVRGVDSVDVGRPPQDAHLPSTLSGMIFASNAPTLTFDGSPIAADEADTQRRFLGAAAFAKTALAREADACAREAVAARLVDTALDARNDPRLLVLDTALPWRDAVATNPKAADVLAVVAPTTTPGEWGLTCAPKAENPMSSKRLLPESWRGLRGEEVEAATRTKGVHFCHAGGFFAAGTGEKPVTELAKQALDVWHKEDRRTALLERARQLAAGTATPSKRTFRQQRD